MGNTEANGNINITIANNSILQNHSIKYIQNLDDTNFGNIDIYKNEQGKYIMMIKRTFMRQQAHQHQHKNTNTKKQAKYKDFGFYEIYDYMQGNPQQQFITPILHTSVKVENLCVVYQVVETYCEYFNFTLADMIRFRKDMDKEEIWLCFFWMVRLVGVMGGNGWVFQGGSLKLNRVFLTLKGTPTVSIHHLQKPQTDIILSPTLDSPLTSLSFPNSSSNSLLFQCVFNIFQLISLSSQISEGQFKNGYELYRRRIQKIDVHLVEIFDDIVKKGMVVQKVIQKIDELVAQGKIVIARQVKLNKFKYVIPKPEIKITTQSEPQKPITITSLHGRKHKQSSSLRNSNKRQPDHPLHLPQPSSPSKSTISSLQTPMNQTMSIKNALLMDEIQNRKRMTEKQKQKLSQRKQIIMSMNVPGQVIKESRKQSGQNYCSKVYPGIGNAAIGNKENILGNSIREVRPSYTNARKESWTKKIIKQHLKQSNKKI